VAQTIAVCISAAATTLAVLVALFHPGIRERRRRPLLVVCPFDPDVGDGTVIDSDPAEASAWARLRIANAPGRDAARSVEVVLESVEPTQIDHERRKWFRLQQDLSVLSGNALKWADRRTTITLDVPPGATRRFDFVHVRNIEPSKKRSNGSLAVPLRLSFRDLPQHRQHLLADLEYRIVISVTALNCAPITQEFFIRFGGCWLSGRSIWTDPAGIAIRSHIRRGYVAGLDEDRTIFRPVIRLGSRIRSASASLARGRSGGERSIP
jgi:hypothetical protein